MRGVVGGGWVVRSWGGMVVVVSKGGHVTGVMHVTWLPLVVVVVAACRGWGRERGGSRSVQVGDTVTYHKDGHGALDGGTKCAAGLAPAQVDSEPERIVFLDGLWHGLVVEECCPKDDTGSEDEDRGDMMVKSKRMTLAMKEMTMESEVAKPLKMLSACLMMTVVISLPRT